MNKTEPTHQHHMNMIVQILKTGNWLDSNISKVLKLSGITHIQFNILRILEGCYPNSLNVGEIKEKIVFSNSDITRLLNRLINKNLLTRKINSKNKRKVDITITTKGLELIQILLPEIEEELEDFYSAQLDINECITLTQLLKKLMN